METHRLGELVSIYTVDISVSIGHRGAEVTEYVHKGIVCLRVVVEVALRY